VDNIKKISIESEKKNMKIVTIIGARPQFIKAATISRVISQLNKSSNQVISEVIVHTGQHYDENMSKIFFQQLSIPKPDYNLEIGGGTHGSMTGRMLELIEGVLLKESPDQVLIYGDTNSTLAGAIAAAKLHIPIAHVEAGLRSFNMKMPEEINRILSDRVSKLLFCPTDESVKNLRDEGITTGVKKVGDVMLDASLYYRKLARENSTIFSELRLKKPNLKKKKYVLVTCHRAENTDDLTKLVGITNGLAEIAKKTTVIFPLHPRTKKMLERYELMINLRDVMIIEPVSYLDMISLEESAQAIITDSGGVQKEAYFFGVPCITLRDETEWMETVKIGANELVSSDTMKIIQAYNNSSLKNSIEISASNLYGDGSAAEIIVQSMLQNFISNLSK
jgi:UDP-GlcNAc3NAcA epimerase